jgi:hypothetical protein
LLVVIGDEGDADVPAKKESSKVQKHTPTKAKKRVAAASKNPAAKRGKPRAKKSATRAGIRPRGKRTAAGATAVPQPRGSARSARMLAQVALQVFTGVVRISGNQSILNGILLIRAGVGDFPSAMGAATQYLLNAGIGDGDNISVAGVRSSVQYGGRTINVIVMTSAQKS